MTRLTVDRVYAHVHGVCFKTGPPGRVGAETEWLVVDPRRPADHVPLSRLCAVMDAAGPPPAASRITYEPGGQLELSTVPKQGLMPALTALSGDLAHVRGYLARHGLSLSGHGLDPLRPPRLQLRSGRYQCMSAYFGGRGLTMMCSTASVQVCVDVGADRASAVTRWRLAHAIGPVLTAAFANSPLRAGRRTGLRSARQAGWSALDPHRTEPPKGDDPADAWARFALDARVMLVRNGAARWIADPGMTFREWLAGAGRYGYPTEDDLFYHLSTLFPPVRARGWFELRMIDTPPEAYWPVPIAVAVALLDDPVAADRAAEATEPVSGRFREAARDALTDPLLGPAAERCFHAALDALPRLGADTALIALVGEYAERYVERYRCPADDVIDPRVPVVTTKEDRTWP